MAHGFHVAGPGHVHGVASLVELIGGFAEHLVGEADGIGVASHFAHGDGFAVFQHAGEHVGQGAKRAGHVLGHEAAGHGDTFSGPTEGTEGGETTSSGGMTRTFEGVGGALQHSAGGVNGIGGGAGNVAQGLFGMHASGVNGCACVFNEIFGVGLELISSVFKVGTRTIKYVDATWFDFGHIPSPQTLWVFAVFQKGPIRVEQFGPVGLRCRPPIAAEDTS
jgi:hypothetical protein